MPVALSEILSSRNLNGDTVIFNAPEDWMQGRTMFGGFLAALAAVAMRDTLGIDMPLRALQINFIGPVSAGEVRCRTHLLRQGKSVSQVKCEIYSQDMLTTLVIGVFAWPRTTALPVWVLPRRSLPLTVENTLPLPFIPEISPNFLRHIEMRWALGSIPYTGQSCWESGIQIRALDKSLSPEVLIVMLSDGPPTPCLSHFKEPVMASSVSWSLELPPIPSGIGSESWFQVDLRTRLSTDGYVHQSTQLWTSGGQLLSLGEQVVAVYG